MNLKIRNKLIIKKIEITFSSLYESLSFIMILFSYGSLCCACWRNYDCSSSEHNLRPRPPKTDFWLIQVRWTSQELINQRWGTCSCWRCSEIIHHENEQHFPTQLIATQRFIERCLEVSWWHFSQERRTRKANWSTSITSNGTWIGQNRWIKKNWINSCFARNRIILT